MDNTALRHAVDREIDRAQTEHNPLAELLELEAHIEKQLTRVRFAIKDATPVDPTEKFVDQFSV